MLNTRCGANDVAGSGCIGSKSALAWQVYHWRNTPQRYRRCSKICCIFPLLKILIGSRENCSSKQHQTWSHPGSIDGKKRKAVTTIEMAVACAIAHWLFCLRHTDSPDSSRAAAHGKVYDYRRKQNCSKHIKVFSTVMTASFSKWQNPTNCSDVIGFSNE